MTNAKAGRTWSRVEIGLISVVLVTAGACLPSDPTDNSAGLGAKSSWFGSRATVPEGTSLSVRLTSGISSETAAEGDHWSGVLAAPVILRDRVVMPVGDEVRGVVTGARGAARGTRAMLDLAVESVRVGDRDIPVDAGTEAVIAGSTRARNLGAIAGGVAAGALLGKGVGGDGHDATIGGILGGAAATGAVAASKGYQVVLKSGTVMYFTVTEPVAMKLGR
jgi:hypothetical protein